MQLLLIQIHGLANVICLLLQSKYIPSGVHEVGLLHVECYLQDGGKA